MKTSTNIKKFINDNAFASVTIGFMVAHAGSKLIESIINGVIMQLIQPMLGDIQWATHKLSIGPFSFAWGKIFANGLHLIIVITVAVVIIKVLQYEEDEVSKSG